MSSPRSGRAPTRWTWSVEGGFTTVYAGGESRVVEVESDTGSSHPKIATTTGVVLERTNARALTDLPFATAA